MPRPAGRRTKTTVRLATARRGKAMDLYARSLRKAPPDLTTLAKRHGGTFPEEYVTNVLRFGFRFSTHGSSEMPVWGPIFQYEEHYNEAAVRQRIKNLFEYLKSIQRDERFAHDERAVPTWTS